MAALAAVGVVPVGAKTSMLLVSATVAEMLVSERHGNMPDIVDQQ